MALTPQEQQELELLEQEEAQLGGLSQQEEQELAMLEQEEAMQNRQAPTGALSPEEEQELALLEQEELELGEPQEEEKMGLLGKGLRLAVSLGEAYDKYLGPSTIRSAVGSVAKGKGLEEAQIMPTTKEAPTGYEIAKDLGVSDRPQSLQQLEQEVPAEALLTGLFSEKVSEEQATPSPEISELEAKVLQDKGALLSPAQIVGTGIDVIADPTIFLGPLKTAGKLAKGATKFALRSSAKAADVAALGGKAEKALDIAGTIAQSTKKRLVDAFKPAVAIDAQTFFDIADKNNIPRELLPEAIEFGKRSVVSKLGRKVTETGGELAQRADKYVVALNKAMNNKLDELVPVGLINKDEAGNLIREAYDEGLEAFFRDLELTHDQIPQIMGSDFSIGPKAKRNLNRKLTKVEKQADRMIKFGVSDSRKAQGRQIKNQVANIRRSGGRYGDTLEQLREIGQAAFKNENKLVLDPPDVRAMRDMYFSLNDAMIDSLREAKRSDLATKLVDSDKALTELFDNKDLLSQIGNKKIGGEQLYRNVIGSGNVNRIEALKSIITPESFTKLKGTFLDNMLKKNSEELISWATSFNRIRDKKPAMLAMFKPSEIEDINDLLRLGIRGGVEVLSTSGTGPSNFFADIFKSIPSSITNEAALKAMKDWARSVPERRAVENLATTVIELEQDLIPKVGKEVARQEARSLMKETIENIPINKWGPRRQGLKALQVISVKDDKNGTK